MDFEVITAQSLQSAESSGTAKRTVALLQVPGVRQPVKHDLLPKSPGHLSSGWGGASRGPEWLIMRGISGEE